MKKRLFVLPLVALMASCSGGATYTETTAQDFETKQGAAQDKLLELNKQEQYFISGNVSGTAKEVTNGKEKNYNFNINFTYNDSEEGAPWKTDSTDEALLAIAESYFFQMAGTVKYTLDLMTFTENKIKYYTGSDGGFKIDGSYKGSLDLGGMKMESDISSMEYIFNEYAMLTSIKQAGTGTMEMLGGKTESSSTVDLKITYKHR